MSLKSLFALVGLLAFTACTLAPVPSETPTLMPTAIVAATETLAPTVTPTEAPAPTQTSTNIPTPTLTPLPTLPPAPEEFVTAQACSSSNLVYSSP